LSYRLIEYDKIFGVTYITEIINIVSSATDEAKYGLFKREADPALRMSAISLK